MKAVTYHRYGPPEVLELTEVDRPEPGPGEVLVEIHAAGVNAGDRHLMRGEPFLVRLMFGLRAPKRGRLGSDLAGRVAAVGADVDDPAPGDEVFGELSDHGFGSFAEYAAAPADAFVPLPAGHSFEEAAVVPTAGLAALQALDRGGGPEAGARVLVNGAAGGVGTFAVQIARARGAEVTAVCGAGSADLVRSLGAHHVIDYRTEDFTRGGRQWDVIVDLAARHPVWRTRRALAPGGTYVMVGGSLPVLLQAMLLGPLLSRTGGRTTTSFLVRSSRDDLLRLRTLLEEGAVRPVLDRAFALAEVPEAILHLEEGHPRGKVVVEVRGDADR